MCLSAHPRLHTCRPRLKPEPAVTLMYKLTFNAVHMLCMLCMLCYLCTRTGDSDGAQAFLPLLGMDASLEGPPGRVLNMSSIYGSYALPFSVRACGPCLRRAG